MSIRREPTYLSTDVWKACWLIARARSTEADEQSGARTETADGVADSLLRDTIKEKYPQVFEHLKSIEKLDKEIIKQIGATK